MDKLYIHQGTPYIIADSPSVFNDAQDIIEAGCDVIDDRTHLSECVPRPGALQIISLDGAKRKFGWFIHKVPGVAVSPISYCLVSKSRVELMNYPVCSSFRRHNLFPRRPTSRQSSRVYGIPTRLFRHLPHPNRTPRLENSSFLPSPSLLLLTSRHSIKRTLDRIPVS